MTEGTGPEQGNRDVVERFFAASERGDMDVVVTLTDEDMVMDWPQSRAPFADRG